MSLWLSAHSTGCCAEEQAEFWEGSVDCYSRISNVVHTAQTNRLTYPHNGVTYPRALDCECRLCLRVRKLAGKGLSVAVYICVLCMDLALCTYAYIVRRMTRVMYRRVYRALR